MGQRVFFKYLEGQYVEKGVLCVVFKGKIELMDRYWRDRLWFNIFLFFIRVVEYGYFFIVRYVYVRGIGRCFQSYFLGIRMGIEEIDLVLGLIVKFQFIRSGLFLNIIFICSLGKQVVIRNGRYLDFGVRKVQVEIMVILFIVCVILRELMVFLCCSFLMRIMGIILFC